MNIAVILFTLGRVIAIESAFMVLPGIVSLIYKESNWWTYFAVALVGCLRGSWYLSKSRKTCSFSQKKALQASVLHGS